MEKATDATSEACNVVFVRCLLLAVNHQFLNTLEERVHGREGGEGLVDHSREGRVKGLWKMGG